MRVLGIDPGLGGALALIDTGINVLVVRDMPVLPMGKGKRIVSATSCMEIIEAFEPDVIWIEQVGAMPKQGVASSFNFGLGYGIILGVVGAVKVPYHMVPPTRWKKHFRLSHNKKQARSVASRLYPKQVALFARTKDDGRAEAALIAHYGLHNPV